MERGLSKVDVVKLQAELVELVDFSIVGYFASFYEFGVLVVVEVDEEVGELVEQPQLLVRVVVFVALPLALVADDAEQAEPI